ncbi:MAG: hypothetical protein WCC36_01075 [Gammaproteobacteria bacterium]
MSRGAMADPSWWSSGVVVQLQVRANFYLGGDLFHEAVQTVGGSSGGSYAVSGPWKGLLSTGRNVTNVGNNRFSYYLALYRTF